MGNGCVQHVWFAQNGVLIVRLARDMHKRAIIARIIYALEKAIYGLKKTVYGLERLFTAQKRLFTAWGYSCRIASLFLITWRTFNQSMNNNYMNAVYNTIYFSNVLSWKLTFACNTCNPDCKDQCLTLYFGVVWVLFTNCYLSGLGTILSAVIMQDRFMLLTAHNWQKWKRVFLTCPCHNIYRDDTDGLKSSNYTWKITIFLNIWNLGQFCENLIFCQ